MFIGHFAAAFAAKRAAPRASLGVMLAAATLLDLLWPVFLFLGWEQVRIDPGNTAVTPLDFVSYPWSHSLVMVLGWSVLAGALYFAWRRDRVAAVVVGGAVLSHWVLDAIAHRPDLPLVPAGTTLVGFGLWRSVAATLAVEGLLFAGAALLYARATVARDTAGRWGFRSFVGAAVVIYLMNLFGPPPPDVGALRVVALSAWLIPLWGWWFDRHRAAAVAGRGEPRPYVAQVG